MDSLTGLLWPGAILIGVIILFGFIRYFSRLYVRVPPNVAAYFFGRNAAKGKAIEVKQPGAPEGAPKVTMLPPGTKVVTGGGKIRIPVLEEVKFLDLTLFSLPNIRVDKMPSKQGVLVTVDAVANIKFKNDAAALLAAGARFLGMSREEIEKVARETLEANLRGVVGQLTVEELIHQRDKFREQVMKEAGEDLDRFGMEIDQFNPQTIADESEYIESLGKAQVAEVKKVAAIGEAVAKSEARKQSTNADREAEIVAQDNKKQELEAQKTTNVAEQTYAAEVAKETATAEQAGPLAKAEARQKVVVEQVKVEEVEANAKIAVEEQNIARETKKQEADVVVPAKAKADARVKEAEGYKTAEIAKAEGDNKAIIFRADAEAHKREAEGKGKAAAIEAEGLAEAEVIKQKLLAEAVGLEKKAEAYKKFESAAIMLEMVRELPTAIEAFATVMGSIAAPMGNIDKVIVYDGGNGDKGNNITKLAMIGPVILEQLLDSAKSMGFDIDGLLNLAKIKVPGAKTEAQPAEAAVPSGE